MAKLENIGFSVSLILSALLVFSTIAPLGTRAEMRGQPAPLAAAGSDIATHLDA